MQRLTGTMVAVKMPGTTPVTWSVDFPYHKTNECFDSAANMGGISRALHTVYKGMFTSSEYTYIVVVNLALQDTLTEMESLQNTLGSYNQLRVFTISYTEVPNV